jgi:hemerythrin
MTLLEWKPQYSVGVPAVDDEHRLMIAMINELHGQLGDNQDQETLEMFLGDIHAAIAAHFALEERFMRKADYDEYEGHKEDHEQLLDQLMDLMDEHLEDPGTSNDLLRQKLGSWFASHFASYDARLHHRLGTHEP